MATAENTIATQKQQIEEGLNAFNSQINELENQKSVLQTRKEELISSAICKLELVASNSTFLESIVLWAFCI